MPNSVCNIENAGLNVIQILGLIEFVPFLINIIKTASLNGDTKYRVRQLMLVSYVNAWNTNSFQFHFNKLNYSVIV